METSTYDSAQTTTTTTTLESELENLRNQNASSIGSKKDLNLLDWIERSLVFYRRNDFENFQKMLEAISSHKFTSYPDFNQHYMTLLDTLAALQVKLAQNLPRSSDKRKEHLANATQIYNNADKIFMYEENHLLGRAYFCLVEGDKVQQAESQFFFVLNQDPKNVHAMMGCAYVYFLKKDFKSALKMFKKAIRSSPNSNENLRVGLGHCFLKLNNVIKAKLSYERALEMNPHCSQALLGLAIINLNMKTQKSTKQGVKYLSMAYSLDPKNPMIANLLADHFFYKKEYDKARKLSLLAFQLTENDSIKAESSFQLARIFHDQMNYEQAFKYYYQSVQLANNNYLKPYLGLAQMYIHRGDLKNAQLSVSKILSRHPDCVNAIKLQIFIETKQKSASHLIEIQKSYEKILSINPLDLYSLINLAQCQQIKSYSLALQNYSKALEMIPKYANTDDITKKDDFSVDPTEYLQTMTLNNMGCLNFLMSKYEIALELFEKAKIYAKNPKLTKILIFNEASTKEKLNLDDDAKVIYKQLIEKDSEFIECHLRLGNIAIKLNDIPEAKNQFNMVLEKDNNSIDAMIFLAKIHENMNELSACQKYYDKILAVDPKDTYTLLSLGNMWLHTAHISNDKDQERLKRHLNRALGYYRNVLKEDNCNLYAANGIGAVLAHRGYFNEAREVFSLVKEASNNFSDVWLNLAHIYSNLKYYDEALKLYQSYNKKFCKNQSFQAITHMARIYLKSNQIKQSISVLQKLVIIDPINPDHLYNFAYLLQIYSTNLLIADDTPSEVVRAAINHLNISKVLYARLSVLTTTPKYSNSLNSSRINPKFDSNVLKSLNDKLLTLLEKSQTFIDQALNREKNKQMEISEQLKHLQDYERRKSESALREIEEEQAREFELELRRRESLLLAKSNIDALKLKKRKMDEEENPPNISFDKFNDAQCADKEIESDRSTGSDLLSEI